MGREDIEGVVAMLSEDARSSMPPLSSSFGGAGEHRELTGFMITGPLSGDWDWRHILRRSQTASRPWPSTSWYEPDGAYVPFALNVLSFDADARKISDVTCFITRSIESDDPESYARFPEQAIDPRRLEDFFLRFGLPASIPA